MARGFTGAPAITAGGLILLLLASPQLLEMWQAWMSGVLADPFTHAQKAAVARAIRSVQSPTRAWGGAPR